MSVYTTRINVTLPMDLMQAIDRAAIAQTVSRSTFIRLALVEKLKHSDFIQNEEPEVPPEIIERLRAQYNFFDECDEAMKRWLIGMELDKLK